MTDLERIEYAVQVVLAKCRADMGIPSSGATVMEWFAAAIREAKRLGYVEEPALSSTESSRDGGK